MVFWKVQFNVTKTMHGVQVPTAHVTYQAVKSILFSPAGNFLNDFYCKWKCEMWMLPYLSMQEKEFVNLLRSFTDEHIHKKILCVYSSNRYSNIVHRIFVKSLFYVYVSFWYLSSISDHIILLMCHHLVSIILIISSSDE